MDPAHTGAAAAATSETNGHAAEAEGLAVWSAFSHKRKRDRALDLHVHWDEELLAEQDKERGTRQKIDEPPTPWAGSPPSVSDDEVEEGADARNARGEAHEDGEVGSGSVLLLGDCLELQPPSCPRGGEGMAAVGTVARGRPAADAAEVAAQLLKLAATRDATTCREPSPASPPPAGTQEEPRITMVLPGEEPKGSSESFKAKRRSHYNEFQAVLALRKQQAATRDDDSDESPPR